MPSILKKLLILQQIFIFTSIKQDKLTLLVHMGLTQKFQNLLHQPQANDSESNSNHQP